MSSKKPPVISKHSGVADYKIIPSALGKRKSPSRTRAETKEKDNDKTTPTKKAASKTTATSDAPASPPARPVYSKEAKKAIIEKQQAARKALKRAKLPDTRSTVTLATDTAKTPVNVYDAVLGESEDLLQAAFEAQSLGRLKIASAYQLLLHARLVGLGKRFDRAKVIPDEDESVPPSPSTPAGDLALTPIAEETTSTAKSAKKAPPSLPTSPAPPTVADLSKLLPPNIEMDSTMVEHLARAAMALHHQRTGRKIQSDSQQEWTVAWSESEKSLCNELNAEGLEPEEISRKLNKTKTEIQIKAFLQNQKQRQYKAAAMDEEIAAETTPRKKGRGRKPPTQAMNTVPNAKLDARTLLSGKGLL